MNKVISYEIELNLISPRRWEGYLREHSGLPGTSLNLELAKAFARTGTLMDFRRFINFDEKDAPENTPDSFLVFCGVLGIGRYLTKYYDKTLFLKLRKLSNDPRKSIREGVVLALRTIGEKNTDQLIENMQHWVRGSYMEQHAAIQSLCNCNSKMSKKNASRILDILDLATVNLLDREYEHGEAFRMVQSDLSRCWSIITASYPEKGKKLIERWIKENDPLINQVMNSNIKILKPLEPAWAEDQLAKIIF